MPFQNVPISLKVYKCSSFTQQVCACSPLAFSHIITRYMYQKRLVCSACGVLCCKGVAEVGGGALDTVLQNDLTPTQKQS